MLCGKTPAVFLRRDDLEGFVIPEHGKDDVADLMHDSAHCYRLFLAGTLRGVIVVNYRIHSVPLLLSTFTLLSAAM